MHNLSCARAIIRHMRFINLKSVVIENSLEDAFKYLGTLPCNELFLQILQKGQNVITVSGNKKLMIYGNLDIFVLVLFN